MLVDLNNKVVDTTTHKQLRNTSKAISVSIIIADPALPTRLPSHNCQLQVCKSRTMSVYRLHLESYLHAFMQPLPKKGAPKQLDTKIKPEIEIPIKRQVNTQTLS